MFNDQIVCEISVCVDCMFDHANGEIDPDRPADLPDVWSELPFGYDVTMGGEHADDCDRTECECGDLGFHTSACDGCGDWHHGDRFRFTLWRATDDSARKRFQHAIGEARTMRAMGSRNGQMEALALAASWRTFLRDRFAERNRHARWLAARNVAA